MAERCQDCARCCIPISFTLDEWAKWQDRAQRPYRLIEADGGVSVSEGRVLPLTAAHQCVFVTAGKRCVIYDERPEVCRSYSSEGPQDMCPWWGGPEPRHTTQVLKREVRQEIEIELPADAVVTVSQQDAHGRDNGMVSIRWTEKRRH